MIVASDRLENRGIRMTDRLRARLLLIHVGLLVFIILSSCGAPYRHYSVSPGSLSDADIGSTVGLLLENGSFVRGQLIHTDFLRGVL